MPSGILLVPQSSSPLSSGQAGLWLSDTADGELMVQKTDGSPAVNISEAIAGGAPSSSIQASLINGSGTSLAGFTPLSVNASGDAVKVDVSDLTSSHSVVGVSTVGVSPSDPTTFVGSGKLANISGLTLGAPVFVSKTGGLTQSYPTIGIGGFVSGDYVIKVGIPAKNQTTPANIDLFVGIQLVGQL